MSSVKKLTRVLLSMLILSSTIEESKSQEGGEFPAEGLPDGVLESVAEGPAEGPADGPAEGLTAGPTEGPVEGVEEAQEDQVSESNEKANNVIEEDDAPKDLDLIENEEGKKSLELFFRRRAASEGRKGNNMLYNNGNVYPCGCKVDASLAYPWSPFQNFTALAAGSSSYYVHCTLPVKVSPYKPISVAYPEPAPVMSARAALEAPANEDSPEKEKEQDHSSIKLTLYPFAVSIQNKGLHYATASLLSYKWLISSAADFYNVRESIRMLRARLGSIDCKRGGAVKRIREIYIHPQYKLNIPNYDLSLLALSTAVTYGDDIKPIAMSPVDDNHDLVGSFLSTYWARLLRNGTPVNETAAERVKEGRLRVSKKTTIAFTECYERLSRYNATLESTTICYHPFINFHSPCMPDSGAPMVVNDELWGVTSSYTPEDCSAGNLHPTYATRLTAPSIRNWITETMTTTTE